MRPATDRIRWRLRDPAEAPGRPRWTRVHLISIHAADLTACHRIVPEAYMVDRNDEIPAEAPACRQCARADE